MVCLGGARRRCRHGLTRRDGPPPHVTLDALGRPAYTRPSHVSEETTMKRRTIRFLVTLALGLLVAPLAAEAQPPRKVPRIGVLSTGSPPATVAFFAPFIQGLRDLGYVEGQHIALEYRYAEGNLDRLPDLAA